MNFNYYFLFLLLIAGCGVKGDPKAPKNSAMPSILENYEDIKVDKQLNDTKKK